MLLLNLVSTSEGIYDAPQRGPHSVSTLATRHTPAGQLLHVRLHQLVHVVLHDWSGLKYLSSRRPSGPARTNIPSLSSFSPPNSLHLGRRPPPGGSRRCLEPQPCAVLLPSPGRRPTSFSQRRPILRIETPTGQTLDESPPSFASLFSPIPPLLLLPNPLPPLQVRRAGGVCFLSLARVCCPCPSFSCYHNRTAKSAGISLLLGWRHGGEAGAAAHGREDDQPLAPLPLRVASPSSSMQGSRATARVSVMLPLPAPC